MAGTEGLRAIAERLAAGPGPARVRVWLPAGVVEGVLEFVDGPLWVVADGAVRTWIDAGHVAALTVVDAAVVAERLASGPALPAPPDPTDGR